MKVICYYARFWFPLLFLALGITPAYSQSSDGSDPSGQTAGPIPFQTKPASASDRAVSLRKLPANLLADQKTIWLFPMKLTTVKTWLPTVAIVCGTSALIATDPQTAPYFHTSNSFNGFNRVFSSTNRAAFIAAVPASFYAVGRLKKDSYARDTALLATEALADGFALDLAFKGVTGRKQPLDYTGNGPYSDSFFTRTHNPFHSGGLLLNAFHGGHIGRGGHRASLPQS